jgi:hypothetical protein
VPPVAELPPIASIEGDDNASAKSFAITTATKLMQTEMSATTTSAMIELGGAQRPSDATVQEWFPHRVTTNATSALVEGADKRLDMTVARKKLAESRQALVKACVAGGVALRISLMLSK